MTKKKRNKPKLKPVADVFLDPVTAEIQEWLLNNDGWDEAYDEDEDELDMIELPMIIKKGSKSGGVNGMLPGTTTAPQYFNTQNTWHSTPSCSHKGHDVVFEHEGKALYAASWTGLNEYSDRWNLIIDLAGNVKPISPTCVNKISNVGFAGELIAAIGTQSVHAELLSLNWPDMKTLDAGLAFWQTLWNNLPAKTVVACMGGHGRTGTCLAALKIIATGESSWDAIATIRKAHCSKAVESFVQEEYLYKLYCDKLEADLEGASWEDAKGIADKLAYAKVNSPKSNSSVGSKAFHPQVITQSEAQFYYGNPVQSRPRAGGGFEDLRCTNQNCTVGPCMVEGHLTWVDRELVAD